MAVQITITAKELDNNGGGGGLEIVIPGAVGNPQEDLACPIFIEYYEGELRVIIWDGEQDPQIIPIKNFKPAQG